MSPGPMIKKEQECLGKEMRAGGQWHGAVWSLLQSRAILGRRSISINRDGRKHIWEADGGHCQGPSARPTAWTWPHVGLSREWHTQMCVLNVISVKGVPGGENTRVKDPWEPTGLEPQCWRFRESRDTGNARVGASTACLGNGRKAMGLQLWGIELWGWSVEAAAKEKEQSGCLAQSQGGCRCSGVSRPAAGHREARSRGQRATLRARSRPGWREGPGRWGAGCAGEGPPEGSRAAGECGAGAPGRRKGLQGNRADAGHS